MINLADRIREYFAALAQGVTGDELAAFYAHSVIQEEFPNRLMPRGARRDLTQILEAADKGRAVMANQTFEIIHLVVQDNRVAVEFLWSGTAKIDLESLKAGEEMRGRFASFIDFEHDRIVNQRSYDCFEPW